MNSSEIAQEMRILEQQRQQIMMQKQSLQFEQNQIDNALSEIKKTNDDVYRMLSGAMLKVQKPELLKELDEKQKSISIHLEAIEKQEKLIDARLEELQKELRNAISSKKK
jgi:prefoldin beta subunit